MNRILPLATHGKPISLGGEPDFKLGGLLVCPSRREIRAEEKSVTVEPRVMQVLVVLVHAEGTIVSRDALIERCWGGRVVVEAAINSCITKVRGLAVLGGEPAFEIETIPKVGYRLVSIARTGERPPEEVPAKPDAPAVPTVPAAATPSASARIGAAWIGGAVVLLGIVVALLWFGSRLRYAPQAPSEASVAVLPFMNMSGDPAKEYFSDGFTEELINDLANNPRLRVTARTSAFAFKGKSADIASIAQALHVRNIVEGSVRESGNRVRITAQLINADDGFHLWSQTFDSNLSDMLSLEDKVARLVTAKLTDRLVAPAHSRPKLDPAVYRLYLQAGREMARVTFDGYQKAVALLNEITTRKPEFSEGYAKLAWAEYAFSEFDSAHYNADMAAAVDATRKALSLDPDNIDAKLMRAMLDLANWNWSAASSDLRDFRHTPTNNVIVLHSLRIYYNSMGFPDLAISLVRRAMSLDPLSDNLRGQLLWDLLNRRRAQEAVNVARSWVNHAPNNPDALEKLCSSYAVTVRLDEAREWQRQLGLVKSDDASHLQYCDFDIDVASGNFAAAGKIVETWTKGFPDQGPPAAFIALAYLQLNDFDRASDWFERAYDRREDTFFMYPFRPEAVKYRTTSPRWKALTHQPAFREWQAEHDRIAAELAAHRDQLQ